ncbi:MAG: fatty acid desaturase, partial [Acidobacteriota bacterium]
MTTKANSTPDLTPEPQETTQLRRKLAAMARPDSRKAWTQLLGTAVPFVVGFALMIWSLDISYFLTLALAVPMVGLYIRLFIFQHDCGHGSYFPSRKANHRLGMIVGVLTLTPYYYWRRTHAAHHAGHGDLERRGLGDITTLTVREYQSLPWHKRLGYRLYRHPLVFLGVGPIYTFVLKHRLPLDIPMTKSWRKEWLSVMGTNLALAALAVAAHFTIGLDKLLLAYVPVFFLGSVIGVWLFYVQHQFEDTYWSGHDDWSFDR